MCSLRFLIKYEIVMFLALNSFALAEEPKQLNESVPKSDLNLSAKPKFVYPLDGEVLDYFINDNTGISLAAPVGTPVVSSADGIVKEVTDELKSYGNLILIKHSYGYTTVYASLDRAVVKAGQSVKRGELIGFSGKTGNTRRPCLYFEIRDGGTPVNPIILLPQQKFVRGTQLD